MLYYIVYIYVLCKIGMAGTGFTLPASEKERFRRSGRFFYRVTHSTHICINIRDKEIKTGTVAVFIISKDLPSVDAWRVGKTYKGGDVHVKTDAP